MVHGFSHVYGVLLTHSDVEALLKHLVPFPPDATAALQLQFVGEESEHEMDRVSTIHRYSRCLSAFCWQDMLVSALFCTEVVGFCSIPPGPVPLVDRPGVREFTRAQHSGSGGIRRFDHQIVQCIVSFLRPTARSVLQTKRHRFGFFECGGFLPGSTAHFGGIGYYVRRWDHNGCETVEDPGISALERVIVDNVLSSRVVPVLGDDFMAQEFVVPNEL